MEIFTFVNFYENVSDFPSIFGIKTFDFFPKT